MLGTTILIMQAVFMPVGMVYAETTMDTEEQEQVELPLPENHLGDKLFEETIDEPFLEEYATNEFDSSLSPVIIEDEMEEKTNEDIDSLLEERNTIEKTSEIGDDIYFSIDVGEYIEVNVNDMFDVEIRVNKPVEALRLIVPLETEFLFRDEKERTLIDTYENGSKLYLINLDKISSSIPVQFSLNKSGQISVEDAQGEIHAAFLYVNTGVAERSDTVSTEHTARSIVNVSTWATFRTAWNNNARTVIQPTANIPSGTTLLNTRTTGVTIAGQGAIYSIDGSGGQTLSWSSGTVSLFNIHLLSFEVSGSVLDLSFSRIVTRTNSSNDITFLTINSDYLVPSNSVPSIDNNGSFRAIQITLFNGWIQTRTPIIAGSVFIGSGLFLINILQVDEPVLDTENLVKTTNSGFAVWDLGTEITLNTEANRFWSSLVFGITMGSVSSSNQATFNDNIFQINNTRQMSSGSGFTLPPVPEDQRAKLIVKHEDTEGNDLAPIQTIDGVIGDSYETTPEEIDGWKLTEIPENATGIFSESLITVTYIYKEDTDVPPVDPLDPEIEVDPENKPILPEDQGQLSIDFVSSFTFGSQAISVHDQTYYAQPQRLLNEDGTVNESEERPNYVQISDRRSENDRNGWTLAVTQKEQFKGAENQVLNGARLSLSNQQVITAQGGTAPGLQSVPCTLVPGNRRTLLHAQGSEGTGTWIYRFGDGDTAGESVALDVPKGSNPEATTYSSTLIWELSAVPGN